jgi:hypothetical protein
MFQVKDIKVDHLFTKDKTVAAAEAVEEMDLHQLMLAMAVMVAMDTHLL